MIQQALFDCTDYEEIEESSEDSLSENNKSGTIAEMKLAIEAMKRDYMVYLPVGHSTKTDLILKKQGKRPITVQVKKATYQRDGGSYKVMVGSSKPSCAAGVKDYGLRYTKYKLGEFDVLAGYIQDCDSFYFALLKDRVGASSFRISPHRDTMNNWSVIDALNDHSEGDSDA